jgi:hypothetical protein
VAPELPPSDDDDAEEPVLDPLDEGSGSAASRGGISESALMWTMNHFSISLDAEDADVPELLERVRASIIELGNVDVFDITFSRHFDGHQEAIRMTVYYNGRSPFESEPWDT